MKNIALSQIDLKIEEVDLAEIKGGGEVIYSGSGKDGRTGGTASEYLVIRDDDSFYHIYVP
jgi:N-acetylmuramic acid 6-phosphate (MurNAc-6-P) etherase